MTMCRNLIYFKLTVLTFCVLAFSFPALAQGTSKTKNFIEEVTEQKKQSSTMKSRSFKTPKKEAAPEEDGMEEEGSLRGIDGTKVTEIPAEKSPPPEEEVWKQYQDLAGGTKNKPLGRKKIELKNEDGGNKDTETEEKPEAKAAKPSLLDEYKENQKNKGKIHGSDFNQ